MLTEKQDKEIFRDVYDFYRKQKHNGSDREKWLECAEEVKQLCDKYKGVKLLKVLIQGIYAQLVEDCVRSE